MFEGKEKEIIRKIGREKPTAMFTLAIISKIGRSKKRTVLSDYIAKLVLNGNPRLTA